MKHVPALDGVRGLAVLTVLAHNLNVMKGTGVISKELTVVMDIGWVGVQLFFVLSGYLITGILLDTKERPHYWRSFLGRRVVRIFPLYYAVLIAAFVVTPIVSHSIEGSEHQIWLWTYLGNWAEPFGLGVALFPHFWSLAIEEQFYLVWPLVVRVSSPTTILRICAGLGLAALGSRVALRVAGADDQFPYMLTICRVDALAAGAAIAALVRLPRCAEAIDRNLGLIRWSALGVLVISFVVTHGESRTSLLSQTYGYSLLAIGFALLVLDVGRGGALTRVFNGRVLRTCGKYSYGMYVFHTPLHLLIGLKVVGERTNIYVGTAYFVVATIVTLVAAMLSFHLFEKHFLALKSRFEPG